VIGDEHFVKIWETKIANGAAAAASGFTGDHGKILLEDPDCLRGMAALVFCIRNGLVDDHCRDMILSSPMLGVPKPDGGIRPICIMESFYKMAAALAIDEVSTVAIKILGPDQFALITGGAESASLAIKALLEICTAAATDIHNAYNSVRRDKVLTGLYKEPLLAPLWRLADFSYSKPTKLLIYNLAHELVDTIDSTDGVHQGDTLASLLFAVALKPIIDKAKADGGPDVVAIADADDVTFAGPPDGIAVTKAVLSFQAGVERQNAKFNAHKSMFIVMHDLPLAPEFTTIANQIGMRIERNACTLLGTPCGRNRDAVQALALDIAHKSERFFNSLIDPAMSLPTAGKLLRICGVNRMSHLARTGFPGEYSEAFQYFDDKIKLSGNALSTGKTNSAGNSATNMQNAAAVKHAGFAYRTYCDKLSPISFLSALAQAAPHILRVTRDHLGPAFEDAVINTLTTVRSLVDTKTADEKLPPLEPGGALSCLKFYCTEEGKSAAVRLQNALTKSADHITSNHQLAQSSPFDAARLLAAEAKYASCWLTDPFTEHVMPSEVHAAARKLRLNLPLSDHTPSRCFCGIDMTNDPWHVLSHKGGPQAIYRHDQVVRTIADFVRKAGGKTWIEPRQRGAWHDGRRPDIRVVLGGE
jgi:hypothetical protein